MKVLIIEDEPFAQIELKRLLALCAPTMEVVSCIDSVEDAVDWIESNPSPDLILMDIQLSDGLSFEIFGKTQVESPVIFTTAYDEYAIKAFKVNSVDYLLKPIEEDALRAAIEKFETLRKQHSDTHKSLNYNQIDQLLQIHKIDYKTRFVVTLGDKIKHIPIEEIAYMYADNNTVYLVNNDNRRYVINYKLDQLEQMLNPKDFFRISRKYLAKISAIGEVNRYFNSRLIISLIPPIDDEILVSRARVPDFMKWMDGEVGTMSNDDE